MSSSDIRSISGTDLSKMSFALWIPKAQPNPYWIGNTQLYVSAPSANVNNAYIGQVMLTGLAEETFVRPTFAVPSSVINALVTNHSDVTVTIVLNVNAGTSGWLLSDLRFGT